MQAKLASSWAVGIGEQNRLVCCQQSASFFQKIGNTLWSDTAAYGFYGRGRTLLGMCSSRDLGICEVQCNPAVWTTMLSLPHLWKPQPLGRLLDPACPRHLVWASGTRVVFPAWLGRVSWRPGNSRFCHPRCASCPARAPCKHLSMGCRGIMEAWATPIKVCNDP